MTSEPTRLSDSSSPTSLHALIQAMADPTATLSGSGETLVCDVVQDSRVVRPGVLFLARDGAKVRATTLVEEAVAKGAVALLLEAGTAAQVKTALPTIEVRDVRRALSAVAECLQGNPTRQLPLVGITGTNGKTTISILVESALLAVGARPGRLGTLGTSFDGVESEGNLTTPEADDISRFIGRVWRSGGSHVVMEASSHALAQGRVKALRFDVAAFTNLTQDHLDFHGSMENYEAAKRILFVDQAPRVSVLNVADPAGVRLAGAARSRRVIGVSGKGDADVRPTDVTMDAQGIRGDVLVAGRRVRLHTRLVGEHNLENLLVALGILEGLGVDLERAVSGWESVAVPGRLERCDGPEDDLVVLVDYAHTPDALARALVASRRLTTGRVHCVFGCGGDRDATKRALMGHAAAQLADVIFVTNDNPRTEDPVLIARAIEEGLISAGVGYHVELDRTRAIRQVVQEAARGDVVLIAGKGHEPYQLIGTTKYPYDDRVEARAALRLRGAR